MSRDGFCGALGPERNGTIESAFENVGSSTLSQRLDELVDAGILHREELQARLEPVLEWAEAAEGDI